MAQEVVERLRHVGASQLNTVIAVDTFVSYALDKLLYLRPCKSCTLVRWQNRTCFPSPRFPCPRSASSPGIISRSRVNGSSRLRCSLPAHECTRLDVVISATSSSRARSETEKEQPAAAHTTVTASLPDLKVLLLCRRRCRYARTYAKGREREAKEQRS